MAARAAAAALRFVTRRTRSVTKQNVGAFFGMASSTHKGSTHYDILNQLDIQAYLKTGKVLFGEWIINGKRLLGGDHEASLDGTGLVDMSEDEVNPPLPCLEEIMQAHDGCASQYAGHKSFHMTARWREVTKRLIGGEGVISNDIRCVPNHGKSMADSLSNVPQAGHQAGLKREEDLFPGPREFVLYSAKHTPTPASAKSDQSGWWSASYFAWGYYSDEVFTSTEHLVPPATPIKGSQKMRQMIGQHGPECNDGGGNDPLHCSDFICSCPKCSHPHYDFQNCECQSIIPDLATRALHFSNSRESVKRRQGVYRQASDGDFKKQLKDGNICATRVDKGSSQGCRDGNDDFWLVKLRSSFRHIQKDQCNATNNIQAGTGVVDMEWYECIDRAKREYVEFRGSAERVQILPITTLIRIPDLRECWEPVLFTSRRKLVDGRVVYVLKQDTHMRVLSAL